ncbi:MAG: hypothetical protein HQL74_10510 [Magnetococcales bacterium]|nr:hypothetical protein [Magnetococcales bacterium]MBF0420492.1 hypothetical protein [Magnetococcales bacterium]
MKYVVELFDGRVIRGLLVEKHQLHDLLTRLDRLDPMLGVVVLDVASEHAWHQRRHQAQQSTPPSRRRSEVDYERFAPIDRIMV